MFTRHDLQVSTEINPVQRNKTSALVLHEVCKILGKKAKEDHGKVACAQPPRAVVNQGVDTVSRKGILIQANFIFLLRTAFD